MFLSDSRTSYFVTVIKGRIVFHDESSQDPDWKL